MTSLLPASTRPRPGSDLGHDLGHRRPLVLLGVLGGVAAAATVLLVCLAAGVVGWFLSDAGAHGTPRDGLRVGALAWLMAHGSGLRVGATVVTALPLGLSALAAVAVWRLGLRVGDSVSGHGPDADRIADGERDWTVPLATAAFLAGYAATAALTLRLAGTSATAPSTPRVLGVVLLLCVLVGGPSIAVGAGRAAIWAAFVPETVRAGAVTARRVLSLWLLAGLATFLVGLLADLDTAANVLAQLHTSPGEAALVVLVSLLLLPNAVGFAGAYLLGPGFAVGTGTVVSPAAVVVGPLPMFPVLAALPDSGTPRAWALGLVAVPVLVAALGAGLAQRRRPTTRWDEALVRGLSGGVVAALAVTVLAALSGGAVGPGRMREVGPAAFDVLVHAVPTLGLGGLLGAAVCTAWQRRTAARAAA